jgi:hypothetical protein
MPSPQRDDGRHSPKPASSFIRTGAKNPPIPWTRLEPFGLSPSKPFLCLEPQEGGASTSSARTDSAAQGPGGRLLSRQQRCGRSSAKICSECRPGGDSSVHAGGRPAVFARHPPGIRTARPRQPARTVPAGARHRSGIDRPVPAWALPPSDLRARTATAGFDLCRRVYAGAKGCGRRLCPLSTPPGPRRRSPPHRPLRAPFAPSRLCANPKAAGERVSAALNGDGVYAMFLFQRHGRGVHGEIAWSAWPSGAPD